MVHEFDGTKHGKPRDMQAARRTKHLDLVRGGMNLAQAAHAVGVSKRTGKAWRNGRTRSTGRNERPLVDWYRGGMDKPKQIDARYLCMDERIAIARHAPRRQRRPSHRPGPRQGAQHHQPRTAPQRRRHRRRVRAAPRPAEGHPPPQTPQATQDHARHTTVGRDQGRTRQALEPRTDRRQAPTRPPG